MSFLFGLSARPPLASLHLGRGTPLPPSLCYLKLELCVLVPNLGNKAQRRT